MTSTYREKAVKAIELAKNLDELNFVEEKIRSTDQLNRRLKADRELIKELLELSWHKAKKLINEGAQPF